MKRKRVQTGYRRFDGYGSSSFNAYITAKNGTIRTNNSYGECNGQDNGETQSYGDLYLIERDPILEAGSYLTSDVDGTYSSNRRGRNIGGARHAVGNQNKGDLTCAFTDNKFGIEIFNPNRFKFIT